jgi:hypothetical protein
MNFMLTFGSLPQDISLGKYPKILFKKQNLKHFWSQELWIRDSQPEN